MAQAIYVQQGKSIDYTPSSAVSAGDVVVVGEMVGIAKLDIAADALGALALEGLYSVCKITGAIDVGDKLYWDADADPVGGTAGTGAVTTTAATGVFIGFATAAAAEADETVYLALGQNLTPKLANIADSEAATVAAMVVDHNALLAALQAAGLMASA